MAKTPRTFSPEFRALLQKLEEQNREEPVWIVGPDTGALLYWLIRVHQPKLVVEIGTSIAYSALWMASALEDNKKGAIWTVESHKGRYGRAQENIAVSGLGHRIVSIKGHAPAIFEDPSFALPQSIDFLFLDATKKSHMDYYHASLEFLSPKAMIVVDNVFSHREAEMLDFIEFMLKNPHFDCVEIPVGAGVLIANRRG